MKIAITGSDGFIGSALSKRLIEDGNTVVAIPTVILLNKEYTQLLISEEKPDVIYHLAAYGNHYRQADRHKTITDNIGAITNLLEAVKHKPIKDCINFSSSSVLLPVQTFYSIAKKTGEMICDQYKSEFGVPVRTIYPYSVFGPGEAPHRFIPTVIRCLENDDHMNLDENAVHDWIYIDDFINGLLAGEVYLGTGFSTSNIRIVKELEDITGKKLSYTPTQMRIYDNKEWKAKVGVTHMNLRSALQETYQYYAKQGS